MANVLSQEVKFTHIFSVRAGGSFIESGVKVFLLFYKFVACRSCISASNGLLPKYKLESNFFCYIGKEI